MVPAAAIPARSVSTCMIAVQPETRQRKAARHTTAEAKRRDTDHVFTILSHASVPPLSPTLLITPVAKPIIRLDPPRCGPLGYL